MTVQLLSLFCFGLVVTFSVFLGVIRAREFKLKEEREWKAKVAQSGILQPAVVSSKTVSRRS